MLFSNEYTRNSFREYLNEWNKYPIEINGRTFFLTREEMLDARIARAKRLYELEISAKERKL
jgi:hypothetical protein